MSSSLEKKIGVWFLTLACGVVIMVALGGITRLTGSGLSIVTWDLIKGIFPPVSTQEWETAFAAYKASPEFIKINYFISIKEFKSIYWLEYGHRLFGRFLFLILFLPSLFLIIFTPAPKRIKIILILSIFLYGLQGIIGWYMVKSGLIDNPFVSPFRLMTHLLMALSLMSLFLWESFRLLKIEKYFMQFHSKRHVSTFLVGLAGVGITIVLGSLVAGFKAGLLYPTFPLMGDTLMPSEIWDLAPWHKNFIENPTTLYTFHRLVAFGSFLFLWIWAFLASPKGNNKASYWRILFWPLFFSVGQVALGALTALSSVSLLWASLHQVNAFCLWGACLFCWYLLRKKKLSF